MDEIENFCKRAYEHVVMESVIEDDFAFINHEMEDTDTVYIIKIVVNNDYDYPILVIYTEDERYTKLPGTLELDNADYIKEANNLLETHGVDSLIIDKGIREWYDTYLVPRIKKAVDMMEL